MHEGHLPRDDNARVRAAGREGDLGRGALLGIDVSVTDPLQYLTFVSNQVLKRPLLSVSTIPLTELI